MNLVLEYLGCTSSLFPWLLQYLLCEIHYLSYQGTLGCTLFQMMVMLLPSLSLLECRFCLYHRCNLGVIVCKDRYLQAPSLSFQTVHQVR